VIRFIAASSLVGSSAGVLSSVAFRTRLIEAGVDPSVGSAGDALDSTLAETSVGAFKNELIDSGNRVPGHAGRCHISPEYMQADFQGPTARTRSLQRRRAAHRLHTFGARFDGQAPISRT
jgi:hypothetical protein